MDRRAWIHYSCPACAVASIAWLEMPRDGDAGGSREAPAAPSEPFAGRARCRACGFDFPGSSIPRAATGPLARCAICGGGEFYVQKDFNRTLGLAIVAAVSLAAFVVMVLVSYPGGLLLLAAVTLADLLVYHRLKEVSVCYLCQSVFHGFPRNPGHRGFYLGNEERFKALRQAWLEGLRP